MQSRSMDMHDKGNPDELKVYLEDKGWQIKNSRKAEMIARLRNANCIMEISISYENRYVSLTVASFKSGRAEYVVYFEDPNNIKQIVSDMISDCEKRTVDNSIDLAENLCHKYVDEVYFFNGDTMEKLDAGNVKRIFDKNQ